MIFSFVEVCIRRVLRQLELRQDPSCIDIQALYQSAMHGRIIRARVDFLLAGVP